MPPAAEISLSGHLRKVPLAVRPIVRAARRVVKAIGEPANDVNDVNF